MRLKEYDAIALAGGAALGAYQISVMEVLRDTGLLYDIKCISGSSVGALNAVLYALGDVEEAKNIWLKKVDEIIDRKHMRGIFEELDLSRLSQYGVPDVYVNVFNKTKKKTESIHINHLDKKLTAEYLLASSAMAGMYRPVKINGDTYADGGQNPYDPLCNYPIDILYSLGYRRILLVALDQDFDPKNVRGSKVNIFREYPDADIGVLWPSMKSAGNFMQINIGDFSPLYTEMRMNIGKTDADNFLGINCTEVSGAELPISEELQKSRQINEKMLERIRSNGSENAGLVKSDK